MVAVAGRPELGSTSELSPPLLNSFIHFCTVDKDGKASPDVAIMSAWMLFVAQSLFEIFFEQSKEDFVNSYILQTFVLISTVVITTFRSLYAATFFRWLRWNLESNPLFPPRVLDSSSSTCHVHSGYLSFQILLFSNSDFCSALLWPNIELWTLWFKSTALLQPTLLSPGPWGHQWNNIFGLIYLMSQFKFFTRAHIISFVIVVFCSSLYYKFSYCIHVYLFPLYLD